MPQIVVCKTGNVQLATNATDGPLTFLDPHHRIIRLLVFILLLKASQKATQIGNHGYPADFAIFRSCFRVTSNNDFSALKVAVRPLYVRCFALYAQASV